MKEREISLIDLMADILLHWRGFVVWMLVGAVLFGAYSYVRSLNAVKDQEASVEAARKQLEQNAEYQGEDTALTEQLKAGMTAEQIRRVNYVVTYEKMYADKMIYLNESLLMQIDPNHVQRGDLVFYVSSDDWQKSHDIKAAYENLVQSGELINYVKGQMGDKTEYIGEVISLGRKETKVSEYNNNYIGEIIEDEDTNIFRVEIVHYDEVVCRDVSQAVMDFILSKQKELEKILGKHEIAVISQTFTSMPNMDIANYQGSYLKGLDSIESVLKGSIKGIKDDFSVAEQNYYDFYANGELVRLNEEIINRGVTIIPGVSVKYVILGMVLMAFLYAFILFLVYVLNTKIRATDQLQDLYELPQLGRIPGQDNPKKFLGFIDQWILSLQNRNRRTFTWEEALELSAVAVKMAAGKEGLMSVCLMGCDLKEQTLAVCETIRERLAKDSICTDILSNVLYDAQAMGQLEKAKSVVLVERAGSTLYTEIVQELELLARQEIKVLGGIVVE